MWMVNQSRFTVTILCEELFFCASPSSHVGNHQISNYPELFLLWCFFGLVVHLIDWWYPDQPRNLMTRKKNTLEAASGHGRGATCAMCDALLRGSALALVISCLYNLLVGGLEHGWIIFPYIGNFIIPTDELISFRGVGIPPTRYKLSWNGRELDAMSLWLLSRGKNVCSCQQFQHGQCHPRVTITKFGEKG